jgi:hypothetical protein
MRNQALTTERPVLFYYDQASHVANGDAVSFLGFKQ